nr:hypothetical protein HK105_007308 [Polyrhizophydium stewartii]
MSVFLALLLVRSAASADRQMLEAAGFPRRGSSQHTVLGYLVIVTLVVQVIIGNAIQYYHNPDLSKRPWFDRFHGTLGRCVMLSGIVNLPIGIRYAEHLGVIKPTPGIYVMLIVWFLSLIGLTVWLELVYGASSRYVEGNVFVAAGVVGAKNLFAMPASERRKSIQSASLEVLPPEKRPASGPSSLLPIKDVMTQLKPPMIVGGTEGGSGNASPYVMSPLYTRPAWGTDLASGRQPASQYLNVHDRIMPSAPPESSRGQAALLPSVPPTISPQERLLAGHLVNDAADTAKPSSSGSSKPPHTSSLLQAAVSGSSTGGSKPQAKSGGSPPTSKISTPKAAHTSKSIAVNLFSKLGGSDGFRRISSLTDVRSNRTSLDTSLPNQGSGTDSPRSGRRRE